METQMDADGNADWTQMETQIGRRWNANQTPMNADGNEDGRRWNANQTPMNADGNADRTQIMKMNADGQQKGRSTH
jgi:hypothetical protein